MTLVFAISGIAVNHIEDWNPNYRVVHTTLPLKGVQQQRESAQLNQWIQQQLNTSYKIKTTFWESTDRYKLFAQDDINILVDLAQEQATIEKIEVRPILRSLNFLHLNEARKAWTYFSDLFALLLIFLSISALFMIKGRNGVLGKRSLIVLAGFAIPLSFILANAS